MSEIHPDCTGFHLTESHWIAMSTMVAFLCAVFALGGWLLADRTAIAVDAARVNERITALEKTVSALDESNKEVVPALARIETKLEDLAKAMEEDKKAERRKTSALIPSSFPPDKHLVAEKGTSR